MAQPFEADDTKLPLLHQLPTKDHQKILSGSASSSRCDKLPCKSQNKEGDCTIDIPDENQNQEPGKYISRVNSELVKTNPDAYKPKLISIGPYHMEDTGLKNGFKQELFQKSLFEKNDKFKEHSTKTLMELKDKARSWYSEDTQHLNDDKFVDMLLLDGCFILEFLLEKASSDEDMIFLPQPLEVVPALMDIVRFENQIPFFVLFELFKLKQHGCSGSDHHPKNNDALLDDLIAMVKRSFKSLVPKLTPQNMVNREYKYPNNLPKHLLQVVRSLCIPRNDDKCRSHDSDDSDGIIEQINTATELENNGVDFMKNGNVYKGYFDEEGRKFNANDGTTMFDLDFSNGILKIPSFKIDDNTEAFLRNMIAYEQYSTEAPAWFSDFAYFMDQLIESTADVNLLRRRGIIVNMMATDVMVAEMFEKLCKEVRTYDTFSGLIKNVNRHGDKAYCIWIGKLKLGLCYSPWKLLSTIGGLVVFILGIPVSLKTLFS